MTTKDYHLFTSLKMYMDGRKFVTDVNMKGGVDKWTKEVVAEFYETGIEKLIPSLTTCIHRDSDYVGKKLM